MMRDYLSYLACNWRGLAGRSRVREEGRHC